MFTCVFVMLYNMFQECSLEVIIGGISFSLEAIRGDDVPLTNPQSSLVIEEIDNRFSEFTSSVIVQVEGELLIFIGTESGILLKVW